MDSHDVRNLLDRLGLNNVSVVAFSEIPSGKSVVFATVVHQHIGHWVAMERVRGESLLVDSYGLPEGDLYRIPFMPKHYIWSNINGQRLGTKYCGLYSVAFHKLRKEGLPLSEALNVLYPEHTRIRNNKQALSEVLGINSDSLLQYYKHG